MKLIDMKETDWSNPRDERHYFEYDDVKEAVLKYKEYLRDHDERCNVTDGSYNKFKEIFGEFENV